MVREMRILMLFFLLIGIIDAAPRCKTYLIKTGKHHIVDTIEKNNPDLASGDYAAPNMKAMQKLDEAREKLAKANKDLDLVRRKAKQAKQNFKRVKQEATPASSPAETKPAKSVPTDDKESSPASKPGRKGPQ